MNFYMLQVKMLLNEWMLGSQIMIHVIHQDEDGVVTRAHQRVPRHTLIRLCLIWRLLRQFLARANFGPGQIQHVYLRMPGYIDDMSPQEFLRCILLPVNPFEQYGANTIPRGCALNDLMRLANYMGGYVILTMYLNMHAHEHDYLTGIFSRMVSRYAPGDRGWAAILQFLYQYAQPWYARERLAELWGRDTYRMVPRKEARDLLRDLDVL